MGAAFGLEGAWLIGQFARDSRLWTAILFYMPSAFVAGCLLVMGLILWRLKGKREAAICGCLMILPLLFVLFVENHWTQHAARKSGKETYRLVHWNVCGGHLGWARVQSDLRDLNADIYVLSEVPKGMDASHLAAPMGGDYQAICVSNMGVIARGELSQAKTLSTDRKLNAFEVSWNFDGHQTDLLAIDMSSNPRVPREPSLRLVTQLMKEHGPDLVIGDFNAPRRSRLLCPLPDGFSHAYDASGNGWSYTWPVPMPMLAIDQCIYGHRILPTHYELQSTTASDHRLQVLDFAMK